MQDLMPLTKKLDTRDVVNRIKLLARNRNLDVREFAEKSRMNYRTVLNIWNGNSNPRLETLVNISNRFNVSLEWFCTPIV